MLPIHFEILPLWRLELNDNDKGVGGHGTHDHMFVYLTLESKSRVCWDSIVGKNTWCQA